MRSLLVSLGIAASMPAFSMMASEFVEKVENKEENTLGYGMAMGYLVGVIKTTNAYGFFGLCPDLQDVDLPEIRNQIVGRVYLDPTENGETGVEYLYVEYLLDEGLFRPRGEKDCFEA